MKNLEVRRDRLEGLLNTVLIIFVDKETEVFQVVEITDRVAIRLINLDALQALQVLIVLDECAMTRSVR